MKFWKFYNRCVFSTMAPINWDSTKKNQFPMMKLRNKKLIFCSTCFVLKATFCNLYQSVFTISDVKALKIDRMITDHWERKQSRWNLNKVLCITLNPCRESLTESFSFDLRQPDILDCLRGSFLCFEVTILDHLLSKHSASYINSTSKFKHLTNERK